jgi:parvulin-like peptidyl-prolyl isomerase
VPEAPRRNRIAAGLFAALAVLGAGAALLVAGCGGDAASLPEGAVARVGDATITEAQLERTIERNRKQAEAQGQTLPAKGAEGYDLVRQQALQFLIQQRIIDFEARKCGTPCRVSDKDVRTELARIRTTNFNDSQKEFDTFLKESGISKADANELVKQDLQRTKLEEHVTRGVRFTEADARKYYEDNPDQFDEPAGRNVRHIVVRTEAEAERIRAEATLDNFAELAREHSTDSGSAPQGGALGTLQRGTLLPAFEKVAFQLKDGEISQPVKTQFGWHIITVDITPAREVEFAEVKDQIIQGQLAQRRQEAFADWSEEVLTDWRGRTVYADDSLKPAETDQSDEAQETPATTTP